MVVGGTCSAGKDCRFAHGPEDIRGRDEVLSALAHSKKGRPGRWEKAQAGQRAAAPAPKTRAEAPQQSRSARGRLAAAGLPRPPEQRALGAEPEREDGGGRGGPGTECRAGDDDQVLQTCTERDPDAEGHGELAAAEVLQLCREDLGGASLLLYRMSV